ncbi:MAG TPA: hypothetical protein VFP40_02965 [Terriglobales bacterium]|nr:hypothetical protein [Terriglobales bacterium]
MTVRRLKTYTGETGYVYQYYFVGQRRALDSPATEYIFDVSADRKTTFAVSVFLLDHAITDWEAQHGRKLVDAERYASAKMRLFRAFDEIEKLMEQGRQLLIGPEEMEDLLATLGVD